MVIMSTTKFYIILLIFFTSQAGILAGPKPGAATRRPDRCGTIVLRSPVILAPKATLAARGLPRRKFNACSYFGIWSVDSFRSDRARLSLNPSCGGGLTTGKWPGRTPATAIPTKRNSVAISIARKSRETSERLLKVLRRSGDFRAEYALTVILNGYHQRISVSVVASP
jgi:hypothetical protein